MLIFRDEQKSASGPDELEDIVCFTCGKRGRAAGHGAFPSRIARMQNGENARAGERLAIQRTLEVASHDEIPFRQRVGGALVRRIHRVFRLHFARAFRGDRPAFAVGLVEEDARNFSLRGVHRGPPRTM